jgi:ribose 5-phosphate isomerase B
MISEPMAIAIGSDHAGFELKEEIKKTLEEEGLSFEDLGPEGTASVDYPDFGGKVAEMVSKGRAERGILICGSGIGMSIVANKFPGVRAALCNEPLSAALSRRHNDSNILVLGGRLVGKTMAREILKTWLCTPFEGGRHELRLNKITKIEGKLESDAPR